MTWAGEKAITQTSLGSLMVIVLVRTVHRNIQHLRVRKLCDLMEYISLVKIY